MKRKEVVLTKETRQKEFVKKLMGTIAPHMNLKPSDKVAIKIDLSGSREIYANTHYETVESLIFYLKENFDVTDISVMEGSDGAYFAGKSTWDIFYKFRYKEVELNGAKLVNLDDMPHDFCMEVSTLSGPKQIRYTKPEADYVISVVPPKTHHIFPATLSIPNITGYVKQEDRAWVYGTSNSELRKFNFPNTDRFVQLVDSAGKNLARLLKELMPSLAVIDGLYGMEGKGPIKGSPVFHGFAVASEDVVLADALTTYIMGFEVDQVSYLSYAYQEGLGNNRWQNIIGLDPCQVKFPYRPHPLFQKQKLWRDFSRNKRTAPRQDRPDRQDKRDWKDRPDRQDRRDYASQRDRDRRPNKFGNRQGKPYNNHNNKYKSNRPQNARDNKEKD
jgi:uncharacterized protein (DUF362 family)